MLYIAGVHLAGGEGELMGHMSPNNVRRRDGASGGIGAIAPVGAC